MTHFVVFGSGVQIESKLIDTHIVEFSKRCADFLIWSLKALGPKIWTQGLNPLKNDCLGPGKSIKTHIVEILGKTCSFFVAKRPLDPKFGPGVLFTSKLIAGVQASL